MLILNSLLFWRLYMNQVELTKNITTMSNKIRRIVRRRKIFQLVLLYEDKYAEFISTTSKHYDDEQKYIYSTIFHNIRHQMLLKDFADSEYSEIVNVKNVEFVPTHLRWGKSNFINMFEDSKNDISIVKSDNFFWIIVPKPPNQVLVSTVGVSELVIHGDSSASVFDNVDIISGPSSVIALGELYAFMFKYGKYSPFWDIV